MLDTFSNRKNVTMMLIDQEDLSILTVTSSVSVLNALSEGFDNSVPVLGRITNPDALKALRTYNQSASQALLANIGLDDLTQEIETKANWDTVGLTPISFGLKPMNEKTEGFVLKRKIANRRQNVLSQIESKLERYASRVINSSLDDIFIPYMSDELSKCKPDEDQYTNPVIEWAIASGLDVKQAYHELSMVTSSANLTTMRLHAHWRFFVNQVNKLDFQVDGILEKVIADAELKLRSGL